MINLYRAQFKAIFSHNGSSRPKSLWVRKNKKPRRNAGAYYIVAW